MRLPKGVWPVMLTPFSADNKIDWDALDRLTDWYIDSGVAGLFAVCLSSEIYELSDEERLGLANRVVRRSNGRVPVVASATFGGAIEGQANLVRQMADTGVDAVVAIVCKLADVAETEQTWKANVERLLEQTQDIPMGLYECPKPYHRVLDGEQIRWCASTGRFLFLKETSGRLELIVEKIEATRGSSLSFYLANTPNLLATLQEGGDGYSGIGANFIPELYVWLCRHFAEAPDVAAKVQRFMSLIQHLAAYKYPVGAKRFLSNLGLGIRDGCRVASEPLTDTDVKALEHLRASIEEIRVEIGIVESVT